jgi:FkbM family methyltransferase
MLERARAAFGRLPPPRFAFETAALGDGPVGKLRLLLLSQLGAAKWPKGRSVRVDLDVLGRSCSCWLADYSQLHVLREVFLDEEYRVEHLPECPTIVDLGSNLGASVIYFRLRHPTSRVIAVEPDPKVFATLRRNVAPFGGVELANVAVASTNGEATFHRYPDSWVSSLVQRWPAPSRLSVQTRTLDTLFDDFGLSAVDLLKIDIEGGEWDVLRGFRQLEKVRNVIGEVHQIGDEEPGRLLDQLSDFKVSVTLSSGGLLRFLATR